MKKFSMMFFLFFFLLSVYGDRSLKVMTFNIRYDNPGDGENQWENRKNKVIKTIAFYEPELLGLQEALHHQLEAVKKALPDYNCFGVGRIDGKEEGEYAPVLFHKESFDLIEGSYFWLSETPEVPGSKSWGTACERIATWVLLKDKYSKKELLFLNTHLDHISEEARNQGVLLISEKVDSILGDKAIPVIITGDFNGVNTDHFYHTLLEKNYKDSKVELKGVSYGGDMTFNGFHRENYTGENNRIDYIFFKNIQYAEKYAIIAECWDGLPVSDHYPVFSVLKLE